MDKEDILMWDETLFRNPDMFELDHVPEHFVHRDGQMQGLMFSLKPAIRGGRPLDTLCLGPPGTGKTTAVKKVFEELRNYTSKVVPVHVNCRIDSTRYTIFAKVFEALFGYSPPSSGVSFKKIFDKIAKHLVEEEKVLVVALDDLNYLFPGDEISAVLYSLIRSHETHPGARMGVIGVLSDMQLKHQLDPRVSSVFHPEEITFPLYTHGEIHDILQDRVRLGFYQGVVPGEVLERIVELTEDRGDLRVGIDLLKKAGLHAERRASKTISMEDVDKAFESSRLIHLQYSVNALKEEERQLLRLIAKEKDSINAGPLYEKFDEATGLGYTRFHEMLNKLDAVRLINTDYTGKGTRGRSRVLSLRYEPDEVLNCLESYD